MRLLRVAGRIDACAAIGADAGKNICPRIPEEVLDILGAGALEDLSPLAVGTNPPEGGAILAAAI